MCIVGLLAVCWGLYLVHVMSIIFKGLEFYTPLAHMNYITCVGTIITPKKLLAVNILMNMDTSMSMNTSIP